jgi:hypothetical protein
MKFNTFDIFFLSSHAANYKDLENEKSFSKAIAAHI